MAHAPVASIKAACDSPDHQLKQQQQLRDLRASSAHELRQDVQEHQTGGEQPTLPVSAARDALPLPYVGVDKVAGRSRWPYRAVLSLPAWLIGDAGGDRVLRCEGYYRTAEEAARAVDTVCMVLLGDQAAVNFPRSSYDASDLDDAAQLLRCISGGAFAGRCCDSYALEEAAAALLLPGCGAREASSAPAGPV